MKNKKFTYFLGLLVLVVWGIILYRIFNSVAGDDTAYSTTNGSIKSKRPYNDYAITKDTTHLLLNYKDPFGLKKTADTIQNINKITTPPKTISQIPKPVFNWSFIKYSGYVRNPYSKKLIAVVNINGKAIIMSEGETVEQIKLVKNMQDSIKIIFNGKTTFIKML